MFIKRINFTERRNRNAAELEIKLQTIASRHEFTPRIYKTEFTENYCEIEMDKIDTMCLADMYGDKAEDLPSELWKPIHTIVKTLYDEDNIVYVDITPYNFIEHKNKVYIIDFGDAYYKDTKPRDWFHKTFLNTPYGWNPDFA